MASKYEEKMSQVALCLYDLYPEYFKDNINLARECARDIITKRGLNPDEIIDNKRRAIPFPMLDHYVDLFISKRKSIYGENEKEVKTPYNKDKRRKIIMDIIKKLTIAVCATAALVIMAEELSKSVTKDSPDNEPKTAYVGDIISEEAAFGTQNNIEIVREKGKSYGSVYYINDREAAKEFVARVTQYPEEFDYGMHQIYFSIKYDRLINMDRIFRNIKNDLANNISDNVNFEVSSMLYEKIKDCEYFLDYVYTLPIDHVEGIEEALIEYDEVRDFTKLSKENQAAVQSFIDEYRANRKLFEKSAAGVELPKFKGEA